MSRIFAKKGNGLLAIWFTLCCQSLHYVCIHCKKNKQRAPAVTPAAIVLDFDKEKERARGRAQEPSYWMFYVSLYIVTG